jgi:hypothetical protein
MHENFNKLKNEKSELEENVNLLREGTIEMLVEKEKIIHELNSKIDVLEENLTKISLVDNKNAIPLNPSPKNVF